MITDMKFTSQPPTVPGAYWWKDTEFAPEPILVLITKKSNLGIKNGYYSSRLVPVEEVEKAYKEGFEGMGWALKHSSTLSAMWKLSHAKQIVDGTKGKESVE